MTSQEIVDKIEAYILQNNPTISVAKPEIDRFLRDLQTVHGFITAFSVRTQSHSQLLVEFVHVQLPRAIVKRVFNLSPSYNNSKGSRQKDPYFMTPKTYDICSPPKKKESPSDAWDRAMKGII